ncbi:OstA-like protein [Mucilaginibacter sp. PAMB04274]|uniref:OstA-like protein n=1 Tax=Mucilaginibacter sp. PAMB04274 TaxID=3138568 RepID=UPI0031F6603B
MRKCLFIYILLLIAAAATAQRKPKTTIVNLIRSDRSEGMKRNGEDVIKVYKGIFQQENSTLRSDSAYFYPQKNSFDAFGNVNINQGDTLNVYGDKLYYNGNTHVALVTDNVRMVDRDATLTTNYLTYNTATRIGTYTGGGKLVNKDNTLISKNGYYFASTRDAYFRYNVVLTTIDATIRTDTLRYNSGTRISYFYGPTRIIGKDKDTLYTERGEYHTITEEAFFSKKNLYTQNTKSLKGDSLYFDRLKGYGRAVKNVTFDDKEQKVTIKGQLGTYYKADERVIVTQNPYAIFITEQRDTTQKDSAVVPLAPVKGSKNTAAKKSTPANSLPVVKSTANAKNLPVKSTATGNDSLAVKPPPRVKRDTIYWGADTLETQIVTNKVLRAMQEKMRLAGIRDTSLIATKAAIVKKAPLKLSTTKNLIPMPPADIKMDMSFLKPDYFGKPKPVDTTQRKRVVKDSTLKKKPVLAAKPSRPDSVFMQRQFTLSDTARIRILSAHHNARIFKSDLQAKADSMFYSYSDSTMRCFVNPMFWTQGSQISGDTIYLQLKNKKLDNMDIFLSAFTVNIEKNDSTHFNQVAGKRMRGFFADNKLQRLFVDGNAETIYFNRDSGVVTQLLRTISSRIRVNFKNNSASNITQYTKVEQNIKPIDKATDDDKILKGFIWKPKDRPVSKESIISPSARKKPTGKMPVKKTPAKAPAGTGRKSSPPGIKPPPADSTATKSGLPLVDPATVKRPMPDSTMKGPGTTTKPTRRDSSRVNP